MKRALYDLHRDLERDHWWFAARREIVLDRLGRALGERPDDLRLLDAGCGMGGLLPYLAHFGLVAGMDPDAQAVENARAQSGADVRQGTLPDGVPFAGERFDVITLLDVLEHIEDDRGTLRTLRALLRPRGLLVITVPAFGFLWSEHDELNEHRRRYTRATLTDVLTAEGFRLREISYYNTLLFPPIAAVRLVGRLRAPRGGSDLGIVPRPVNALLRGIFGAERWLLRAGSLPFGVSLIAIAERGDDAANMEERHERAAGAQSHG